MTPVRRLVLVIASSLFVLSAACSASDQATETDDPGDETTAPTSSTTIPPITEAPSNEAPTTEAPPTTSAPTTAPPTTAPPTTEAPTTTAPPPPEPDTWKAGSEGPEVAAVQTRLAELGFHVPVVDGKFGSLTQQAVLAFQKGAGLGRDGVVGPQTLAALDTAEPIGPREGGDHIEIDLARQLMFVVRGEATFIFNTSTGTSGWETPPGRFTITREIDGMRHAPLGDLWRPKYFNGGIALHGSNSIPGHPASHGCARLHNDIVNMIWDQNLAPVGTPVWVY